jgi:inorganic pyrophosphatase/exopolyphosphatase
MTSATHERVDTEIKKRRAQVVELQAELVDLEDYLDILEARKNSMGKKTFSQAEMERRYAGKTSK